MAPHDWLEIALQVASADAEVVADLLRTRCPGGVAIELKPTNGLALVRGYLPPGHDPADIRRALRLALRFAPLSQPPRWCRPRRLRESTWREGWKRHFKPLRVGEGLVVKPPWSRRRARPGEIVIQIDPGPAFGTGQHPTTAMCLRALEDHLRPGAQVLDLGTGSGILAIAAAKLGAQHVLALDIDPLAVKAARQNAEANDLASRIHAREGTLDRSLPDNAFDLLLANISGPAIQRMIPDMARVLRPGGILIASGFLEETQRELEAALRAAGLDPQRVLAEGLWRALVARRRDPPPEQ